MDDLKKLISKLESMIERGQDNLCLKAIIRSKKNELNRLLTGTPTSITTESEDEHEDRLNDYSVKRHVEKISLIVHLLNKRSLFQINAS